MAGKLERLLVVGHCLSVVVLLLVIGGALVTSNVREAIALRDAGRQPSLPASIQPPANAPATAPAQNADSAQNGTPSDETAGEASKDEPAADQPWKPQVDPQPGAGPGVVNQIPRVRVAAIVLPLGVGFLLLVAGILAWATGSAPAAQVAATLAGVAGVLMFLLGLEYIGSLLNWGADSLGGSVAALFASGLACVSLPLRLWWFREDVSDRDDDND